MIPPSHTDTQQISTRRQMFPTHIPSKYPHVDKCLPYTQPAMHGKKVRFCTYKEQRYLPRSVFQDYDDCVKCTCKGKGLQCATIGFRVTVPEDSECDNVLIGRKNRWVLKRDNTKKCPKKKIPQNISAVGK
ncbi:uncharacterized protein LOC128216881 [Mya arenaria]|uniref:uncharacterized protein LOC128216881 n=1 Tax=Mya arenaria TaxID=6604 RepID=UPI0022E24D24|nr:uncharacterized protein LOC128216881 [Mya arenaria]